MGQKCCICSGPPAVLENVDRMLRNKITMSRIAALAGCSKSAVGRHSLNCVPKAALKEHGAAYHRRRLIIQEGNPPNSITTKIYLSCFATAVKADPPQQCSRATKPKHWQTKWQAKTNLSRK